MYIIMSIKVCQRRRRAQRKTFSGKLSSGGDTLQPTARLQQPCKPQRKNDCGTTRKIRGGKKIRPRSYFF